MPQTFSPADTSRIIEMAWEDRTPFEAIEQLYGLNQHQLIKFMRRQLNAGSFRLWRARTSGRVTGRIRYGKIVVEEGGQLSGDIECGATAAPRYESGQPARRTASSGRTHAAP